MESSAPATGITGIVLAAGAGTRFGMPKALARTAAGKPWVAIASELLLSAGCDRVVIVLGAAAEQARALVPTDERVSIAVAEHWAIGMSESIRVGILAASGAAALVSLVDLPDLPLAVALRVVGTGAGIEAAQQSLRHATFGGRPGHPVLIGNSHWAPLVATLHGDHGAREYLRAHGATGVECSDLFDGHDVDR
jgi:CTP:molybdopterin cytidylyltransferase MocA